MFQLALPRRERQSEIRYRLPCEIVSTRAPAKGATLAAQLQLAQSESFNSRSREGSDDVKERVCDLNQDVSTRAPAKGATVTCL